LDNEKGDLVSMEFLLATIPSVVVGLTLVSRRYLRHRRCVKDRQRTKWLLLAFRNSF
jgi:hypothetical protein